MSTPQQIIDLALTKVGYRYDTGPSRTTGAGGYFDCSGFTYFLNQHVGGPTPGFDPQSHLQALYCRDHGLLTSIQNAIDTPGALLFEGPNHAYVGGAGIPGHVAVSLGNGKTVEAMGHAWGVCIGSASMSRGWSNAGHFPGINYASPHSPVPDPGQVAGPPQLIGDQMAVVIPSRAKINNGRKPYFNLNVQDDQVIAYNGARLKWRMPAGKPQPKVVAFGQALVYDIPIAGPFLGMEEDVTPEVINGEPIYSPNNLLVVLAGDGGCAFADIVLP